jgi:hypothetical protein
MAAEMYVGVLTGAPVTVAIVVPPVAGAAVARLVPQALDM